MISFYWHRRDNGRHGVSWQLWDAYNARMLGVCLYMPGSKNYLCKASAPVKGGVVFTSYIAGTSAAARNALERDWSRRSIGLFGEDEIRFTVATP